MGFNTTVRQMTKMFQWKKTNSRHDKMIMRVT